MPGSDIVSGGPELAPDSIKSINNTFTSSYCCAPCGLTNIFNYNNKIGCYESIKIKKDNIINLNNFNSLQRGKIKKYYKHYLLNPVGCLKSLDINFKYSYSKTKTIINFRTVLYLIDNGQVTHSLT